MSMIRQSLIGCGLALALALAGSARAQAPAAPSMDALKLDDQFEQLHSVPEYRGHVLVLLYGDRGGLSASKELGQKLHVYYHPGAQGLKPAEAAKVPVKPLPKVPEGTPSPDVFVVPVACIGKVPTLVRNVIRNQVKKGSPDARVWLDYTDTMKGMVGLTAGVPNLLVIDAWGRLRHKAAGELTDEQYAKVLETIDGCRAEAAAAPRAAQPSK
jgi:hypothetical protein